MGILNNNVVKTHEKHLEKFDFFRGLAILLVFSFHSFIEMYPHISMNDYNGLFLNVSRYSVDQILWNLTPFAFGWSGVEFFLVISGFLIHYQYMMIGSEVVNYKYFFNKRFWRIYPPYFLVLIILSLASLNSISGRDVLTHVFLLHNLNQETFFTINGSFWSLALEMQLYLLYPVYLYIRGKKGIRFSLFIVSGIFLFLLCAKFLFNIKNIAYETSAFKLWIIWVIGAILAEFYYSGKRIIKANGIHIVVLFLAIIMLRFTILYPFFSAVFLALFYAVFIEWFLYLPLNISNIYSRILYKGISIIGICSYSMYLIHQPVLRFSFENYGKLVGNESNLFINMACYSVLFLFIVFLSYTNFYFIERNAIKYGKVFYEKYIEGR